MYFGGLNDGSALQYFTSLGFQFTPGDNLAEWLVTITGGGVAGKTEFDFAGTFERSSLASTATATLGQLMPAPGVQIARHTVDSETAVSIPRALSVLFRYRSLKNFASPDFLGPRFGDKVIFSFILFSLYIFMGPKTDPTSIVNIVSSLFMMVILPAYGAASYVPAIVLDRKLFNRERADGCYLSFTYLTFKMIEEAIVALAAAAVFVLVIYWSIQYQGTPGLFYLAFYMVRPALGACLSRGIAWRGTFFFLSLSALSTLSVFASRSHRPVLFTARALSDLDVRHHAGVPHRGRVA